jgi:CBS domain-containing protein
MLLHANANGESLSPNAKSTAERIVGFHRVTKVSSIIGRKTSEAVTISAYGNLKAAANLMRGRQVPALAVLWNREIVGLVTERDIVVALSIHNEGAGFVRVKDAMSPRVVSISPDDTIEHAKLLMATKRCHHLPIVDDGKLVGMLSLGDILK